MRTVSTTRKPAEKRTIVFDRELLVTLDRVAKEEGRTRSNLVRHLLARELERRAAAEQPAG